MKLPTLNLQTYSNVNIPYDTRSSQLGDEAEKKVLTNKHEKKSAGTGFRHITFAILGSNLIKHLQVHITNLKKWLHQLVSFIKLTPVELVL